MTLIERYEIESVENERYDYDFDEMNFILEARFKSLYDAELKKRSIKLHKSVRFNELKPLINETNPKKKITLKKGKLTLIPFKSISKWIGVLVEKDANGDLVRLELVNAYTNDSSQSEIEFRILKSTFPQFENIIEHYNENRFELRIYFWQLI